MLEETAHVRIIETFNALVLGLNAIVLPSDIWMLQLKSMVEDLTPQITSNSVRLHSLLRTLAPSRASERS